MLSIPIPSLLLSSLLLLALYALYTAIHHLILHPLSSVPGPFLARLTSKNLTIHDILGYRAAFIDRTHRKYGPVVRIAPDELSFNDPSLIKEIYGQGSPYMKSEFYDALKTSEHAGTFETRSRMEHRQLRRLISAAFSPASVLSCEAVVASQIRKFLIWVREDSDAGTSMNVFVTFRQLLLDISGSLFFGSSFGALDQREPPQYVHDLDGHLASSGIKYSMPYLFPLTSWIPIPAWQDFVHAKQRVHEFGARAVRQYIAENGREESSGRMDILQKVLAMNEEAEKQEDEDEGAVFKKRSDDQIACEGSSMVVGGTDTTATVLTFTCWELSRHPEWQAELRRELDERDVVFVDGVPAAKQVLELPKLDAVVHEALRCYPAALTSLPRVVPAEGATLAGLRVPGGTVISMQALSLHTDPSVFSAPVTFDPSRWLTPDAGRLSQMRESWIAFSRGARQCIGIGLAIMELKLMLSAFLRGWSIEEADGTNEQSMAMLDHFVPIPKGGRCDLRFKRL